MRPLALVVGFWLFVALLVGWALGLIYAIDADHLLLVAPLIAVPVLALSAFLWACFRVMLDG